MVAETAAIKAFSASAETRQARTAAEVSIRPAEPRDLPAVAALLEAAGMPFVDVLPHLGQFLVAEAEGRVVGAAGAEISPPMAFLRSLVVVPDWQGRGLGKHLSESIEAHCAAAGLGPVDIRQENCSLKS